MSLLNFSDYRRWIHVNDFREAVLHGAQIEQLWHRGANFSESLECVWSGTWKARLFPQLADRTCYTFLEMQLVNRTLAHFPFAQLRTAETFGAEIFAVALWITVPAPYFAQMISALSQGGSWQLSAHNLRFGDRQHMNFCYSPRSSVLWYIFQLSIGQIQGEHFGQEYFVRPITFSLRLSTADFEARAHNWNRYYVDFFTYLAPEFVLSPRHTFTLKSMVLLTHGFNLQTLLTVFNHVRSGRYPALCMLMRIPIGKQQYDFATQPSYGSKME
jgi:hypothetical protein